MTIHRRLTLGILTITALCLATLLSAPLAGPARAAMPVFVSILPQKYFVKKIAGDLVDVSVLVMPGASPHTYEPSPRQMAELANARAYFAMGVNFEDIWLPRIRTANPSMPVIRTDAGIAKMPMAAHHHHDEHEGPMGHNEHEPSMGHPGEGHHDGPPPEAMGHPERHHDGDRPQAPEVMHADHHDQGILDPHVWLSPDGARIMTENIRRGLAEMDPGHAAAYNANAAALLAEIDRVDAEVRAALSSLPPEHRSFMVFHPSWGYFAACYGLHQIPIEIEGREPSPKGLSQVIDQGRALGITVIFVQPQLSKKSATVIAGEIGARVAELDPLAEDWAGTMLDAARAIGQAAR
jgi:zinc transport system substrate-binding protein